MCVFLSCYFYVLTGGNGLNTKASLSLSYVFRLHGFIERNVGTKGRDSCILPQGSVILG